MLPDRVVVKSLAWIACSALFMLAIFLPLEAAAFQAGLKGGYHFYAQSPYLDFLEKDLISAEKGGFHGPGVEAFIDFSLLPLISLEVGLGGYTSETGLSALDTDLELTAAYVVITPKLHYWPVGPYDFYSGLGVGYYSLDQSLGIDSPLVPAEDVEVLGLHGTIGSAFPVAQNILFVIEGRYIFAPITDIDDRGHDFDAGGLLIQAGFALTW